ncbi:MAG: C40 family peptidase [Fibrobacterota bacterium]
MIHSVTLLGLLSVFVLSGCAVIDSDAVLPSHVERVDRKDSVEADQSFLLGSSPRYEHSANREDVQDSGDGENTGTTRDVETRKLTSTARSYLGVPYRYGGTTRRGMDCSGLVYRVYRDLGYDSFQRVSSQSLYRMGRRTQRHRLQPGDLCFFSSSGRINHVGFYMGNNTFIHASSSRGVIITSLDDPYWSKKSAGFRTLDIE